MVGHKASAGNAQSRKPTAPSKDATQNIHTKAEERDLFVILLGFLSALGWGVSLPTQLPKY